MFQAATANRLQVTVPVRGIRLHPQQPTHSLPAATVTVPVRGIRLHLYNPLDPDKDAPLLSP